MTSRNISDLSSTFQVTVFKTESCRDIYIFIYLYLSLSCTEQTHEAGETRSVVG